MPDIHNNDTGAEKPLHAWLVYNSFNTWKKFTQLYDWLIDAAKSHNIELVPLLGTDVSPSIDACNHGTVFDELDSGRRPDFVIFWDKDITLCEYLQALGIRCMNTAEAIEACDDKGRTFARLSAHGIRQPRTFIVPLSFHKIDWNGFFNGDDIVNDDPDEEAAYQRSAASARAFIEHVEKRGGGYPLVVKTCKGSFGSGVYLANNRKELLNKLTELSPNGTIVQQFVSETVGTDVRVQVVGGKAVAAMRRTAKDGDFRANITNGGTAKGITPTAEQVALAVSAANALGLDFAGVDLLDGDDGKPVVCEVNSNAHFVNLYNACGVNVADAIMEYAYDECREPQIRYVNRAFA